MTDNTGMTNAEFDDLAGKIESELTQTTAEYSAGLEKARSDINTGFAAADAAIEAVAQDIEVEDTDE